MNTRFFVIVIVVGVLIGCILVGGGMALSGYNQYQRDKLRQDMATQTAEAEKTLVPTAGVTLTPTIGISTTGIAVTPTPRILKWVVIQEGWLSFTDKPGPVSSKNGAFTSSTSVPSIFDTPVPTPVGNPQSDVSDVQVWGEIGFDVPGYYLRFPVIGSLDDDRYLELSMEIYFEKLDLSVDGQVIGHLNDWRHSHPEPVVHAHLWGADGTLIGNILPGVKIQILGEETIDHREMVKAGLPAFWIVRGKNEVEELP